MFAGARMQLRMLSQSTWLIVKSATNKVIRHMNVGLEPWMYQNLKDAATIVRIMDTNPLNVDPSPHGH